MIFFQMKTSPIQNIIFYRNIVPDRNVTLNKNFSYSLKQKLVILILNQFPPCEIQSLKNCLLENQSKLFITGFLSRKFSENMNFLILENMNFLILENMNFLIL